MRGQYISVDSDAIPRVFWAKTQYPVDIFKRPIPWWWWVSSSTLGACDPQSVLRFINDRCSVHNFQQQSFENFPTLKYVWCLIIITIISHIIPESIDYDDAVSVSQSVGIFFIHRNFRPDLYLSTFYWKYYVFLHPGFKNTLEDIINFK